MSAYQPSAVVTACIWEMQIADCCAGDPVIAWLATGLELGPNPDAWYNIETHDAFLQVHPGTSRPLLGVADRSLHQILPTTLLTMMIKQS